MPLVQPPGQQRRSATHEDAARLESLCGVHFSLEDLPSLLDPRGLRFQRLEWMGDAVLDALLAQHRRTGPGCCDDRSLAELCSDAALSERARGAGLAGALDWEPSPGRLADLVEALVGAAWMAGPPAAVHVAEVLVHAGLTLAPVLPPAPARSACEAVRPDAQLGSALLEAADSLLLMEELPEANEGELSTRRNDDISGYRLAERGRRLGLVGECGRDQEHALDHVQAAIGRVGATEGVLPGLRLATRALRA